MKALLTLMIISPAASAQLSTADPAVQAACARTVTVALPVDMTGLAVPKLYPRCDSYTLYEKKDYTGARTCAIQERLALLARLPGSPAVAFSATTGNDGGIPAGGLVVLAQMYANGEGVARNPALAERFFCEAIDTNEVEHDPSSSKDILATLQRLRETSPASKHFDLCLTQDGVTTDLPDTPSTRYCDALHEDEHIAMHSGGIQAGIDGAQKDADDADAAIKPVLARFSPLQRAAYRRAIAAMQHFIDVQVTGDALFVGGYGSGGLYPNEERAAFENQVVALATDAVAKPSGLAQADAELNRTYRLVMDAAILGARVPREDASPEGLRAE